MRDECQLWTPRILAPPVPNLQCVCYTSGAVIELVHSESNGGQRVSYHEINQASPSTSVSVTIPVSNVTDDGTSAIGEGDRDGKLGMVCWGNL
jgi:hypothetical protein